MPLCLHWCWFLFLFFTDALLCEGFCLQLAHPAKDVAVEVGRLCRGRPFRTNQPCMDVKERENPRERSTARLCRGGIRGEQSAGRAGSWRARQPGRACRNEVGGTSIASEPVPAFRRPKAYFRGQLAGLIRSNPQLDFCFLQGHLPAEARRTRTKPNCKWCVMVVCWLLAGCPRSIGCMERGIAASPATSMAVFQPSQRSRRLPGMCSSHGAMPRRDNRLS